MYSVNTGSTDQNVIKIIVPGIVGEGHRPLYVFPCLQVHLYGKHNIINDLWMLWIKVKYVHCQSKVWGQNLFVCLKLHFQPGRIELIKHDT